MTHPTIRDAEVALLEVRAGRADLFAAITAQPIEVPHGSTPPGPRRTPWLPALAGAAAVATVVAVPVWQAGRHERGGSAATIGAASASPCQDAAPTPTASAEPTPSATLAPSDTPSPSLIAPTPTEPSTAAPTPRDPPTSAVEGTPAPCVSAPPTTAPTPPPTIAPTPSATPAPPNRSAQGAPSVPGGGYFVLDTAWDTTYLDTRPDGTIDVNYTRGGEHVDLHLYPAGSYDATYRDRSALGTGTSTTVAGRDATTWAYGPTDHTTIRIVEGKTFLEVRGRGMDLAAYQALLDRVVETDVDGLTSGVPGVVLEP